MINLQSTLLEILDYAIRTNNQTLYRVVNSLIIIIKRIK
jgi:hypothetical protein